MKKMKAQHTPGPWDVYDGPNDKKELTVNYIDKSGQIIMVADCNSAYAPPKERDANARLIAAAPELLEACKAFLDMEIEIDMEYHKAFKVVIDKVTAAIAKAEGRDAM